MLKEFNERINLFLPASLICCLDLFITVVNQKPGFWAGAKSMVKESDRIVAFAMTRSSYGLFLITLVYLAILYLAILKLPLLVSRIISLASILGNSSGFISWIWFDYPQIFSISALLLFAMIVVLLNYRTKVHRILRIASVTAVVLLFLSSFLYAFMQKNFSDLSVILEQEDFISDTANLDIFSHTVFLSPEFVEMDISNVDDNSWPYISSSSRSIVFYSPLDLRELIRILRKDLSMSDDIDILNQFIAELLELSDDQFETGKMLYIDYPKDHITFDFSFVHNSDLKHIEIDYDSSDIYYTIQFIYDDSSSRYIPVRCSYDFDLFLKTETKSYSRYTLCVIDENRQFLSMIMK